MRVRGEIEGEERASCDQNEFHLTQGAFGTFENGTV